ncbi:efflux RND transporter periplasmic adaptor subunit [Vibrio comitans]|uniref:Hemolysin D n=1 Tax=Vibrio comitans NBRC 102076 TaxID=1219078 RepID=A0A4Y3ISZ4_9VIBR|nr:efflux RND transporter periplasmic adaptor subunit [Vibrio comitans]GEA61918.1 hemolysin D [Vibrio comitans NBRC 102076]
MKFNQIAKVSTIALALASAFGCSDTETGVADKSARPVNVIQLGNVNESHYQHFPGRLQSEYQANVSFRVAGMIEEVFVAPGDVVSKGQKLAKLDDHDYNVVLLELQARLSEAESAYALAASEYKRVKQATSENAIASVNLDRARSAFQRSKAAIEVVKQNIEKARDAIRYTTLLAPFDGVVGEQYSEQFEQILPGVPVFNVHKPSSLEAVVDVPETLITKIRSGLSAEISWHGSTDTYVATVSEIGTVPHPIKQTYTVSFTIDDKNLNELPGKAVAVSVDLLSSAGSYCVPYTALKGEKGQYSLMIIENGRAMQKPVEIDHLQTSTACVVGNLSDNEYLVTAGVSYLEDNDPVGEMIDVTTK